MKMEHFYGNNEPVDIILTYGEHEQKAAVETSGHRVFKGTTRRLRWKTSFMRNRGDREIFFKSCQNRANTEH